MRPRLGLVALILCGFATAAIPLHASEPARVAACGEPHWVGAWAAAPGFAGQGFADQTLRLIVTPHIGGRTVRVRLTNRFGSSALRLDKVAIGRRRSGASIAPGSNRKVTFDGKRFVVIPRGKDGISDRVRLGFRGFGDLAISIYVRGATGPATAHPLSLDTSYVTAGDRTSDPGGTAFAGATIGSWPFLAGIDVLATDRKGAVIAFGDSITDGVPGGQGRNRRYSDFLARRLAKAGSRLSVLNAGLGGNRILSDAPAALPSFGPSGLSRFRKDVPQGVGATDVIVLEGINDGRSGASAARVIRGLERIVSRLQRRHLNVLVGTLTPAGDGAEEGHESHKANATRLAVNRWLRRSALPDGLVDFDAAVRDPAHPSRLAARYDSGDRLHPNAAGYRRMAASVKLRHLKGPGCGTTLSAERGPGR